MKKKLFLLCIISFYNIIFSQINIGSISKDPSAILDINVNDLSTKKGVLFPKVALTSIHDTSTIPNPAQSLIVYNTGENAGLSVPGFYYWDDNEWRLLDNSSGKAPSIDSLQCGNAFLTPPKYIKDQEYNGTITLPYTMGNGGRFAAGKPEKVNGLTYVLQPGKLNYGNGNIYYTVTGKPGISSPKPSVFKLKFLNFMCSDTLGDLNEISPVMYARKYTTPIDSKTPAQSITTIGNIQVRYNGKHAPLPDRSKVNAQKPYQDCFIEFRPLVSTHVTIKYEKAGEGGQNLQLWGIRDAAFDAKSDGTWYKLADEAWVWNENPFPDPTKNYPDYSSNHRTFPDLNPGYRDIGTALLVFHNTQEVYRITLNVNGNINEDTSRYDELDKGIDDYPNPVRSGVTIFVEKLE